MTVTLSATTLVDHKAAYNFGLKPLLRVMREKWGWTDYVWKAELQKRGQLHWHITGNQFLDWRVLRSLWNNIQYERGWLAEYNQKTGGWNANSTDIHAVSKVRRIDLYLAKYISKDGGAINGKVWGCSDSLRGKRYFSYELEGEAGQLVEAEVAAGRARKIVLENCSIYDTAEPQRFIPASQIDNWHQWLR